MGPWIMCTRLGTRVVCFYGDLWNLSCLISMIHPWLELGKFPYVLRIVDHGLSCTRLYMKLRNCMYNLCSLSLLFKLLGFWVVLNLFKGTARFAFWICRNFFFVLGRTALLYKFILRLLHTKVFVNTTHRRNFPTPNGITFSVTCVKQLVF